MTMWELVNPEGAARPRSLTPAPRPSAFTRIGLAWNGKPGGAEALDELARLLSERFAGVQFVRYWEELPESVAPRELSDETINRMAARKPDVVIVSQGD